MIGCIVGCSTRDGLSRSPVTRPPNPFEAVKNAVPGLAKRAEVARQQSEIPSPKARRVPTAPTEDLGGDLSADMEARMEGLKELEPVDSERFDSYGNEAIADRIAGRQKAPKEPLGERLFRERDPVGKYRRPPVLDEADYDLPQTDPKAKAAALLAEAEAMEAGSGVDYEPDLPPIEGLDQLLWRVGGKEVFASRAGEAALISAVGDTQLSFERDGTGSLTTYGPAGAEETTFQWVMSGEQVRVMPQGGGTRLPGKFELHSHGESLFLFPAAHARVLKETIEDNGDLRERDLAPGLVFDAVRDTFKLVDSRMGARSKSSRPRAVVGAAAAGPLVPAPNDLQGEDRDLREAMDSMTVGQIRWNSGVRLDDTVTLLSLIWDENADADTPDFRFLAAKALREVKDPTPFTSRTSLTFTQILQELSTSYNARVEITDGIVKLVPR